MHPALLVLFTYVSGIIFALYGIRYCNQLPITLTGGKLPPATAFLSWCLGVHILNTFLEYQFLWVATWWDKSMLKQKLITKHEELKTWINYP